MKKRILSIAILSMLLIGVLPLGVFILPVSTDEVCIWYSDSDWTGAYTNGDHSTLQGSFDSQSDAYYGTLGLKVHAGSFGWAWAEGYVWMNFTYNFETEYNVIELTYYLEGDAYRYFQGHWKFTVKAEVWDCASNERLHQDIDIEEESSEGMPYLYDDWEIAKQRTIGFLCRLEQNGNYGVCLIAKMEASADKVLQEAEVDFYDGSKVIDLNALRVSHSHQAPTTTSYCIGCGDIDVHGKYQIEQDDTDSAEMLYFRSTNKDAKIKGWKITISKFNTSYSERDGKRAVKVWASGTNVPRGATVEVDATQWLDEKNHMGLKDVEWTPTSGGAQAQSTVKAMPDHHWSIGYPALSGSPEYYKHCFTMTNDDPSYTLSISALSFLPTMMLCDPAFLNELEFPSPVFSFSLLPGQSWTTYIITEGSLHGGYIYFKYSIDNLDGTKVICNAWGEHPIVQPGWGYRKELVGIVNMEGYGLENDYTFLNAYRASSNGPMRFGCTSTWDRLNILYSDWSPEYALLNRVCTGLMSFNPYTLTVQPWVAQDWESDTWIDPRDGCNKTAVTYWLRKDVGCAEPCTGNFVDYFDALDYEFAVWYNYAFDDSWRWSNFMDVHHLEIVNNYQVKVYFDDLNDYFVYAPTYPLLGPKPILADLLCEERCVTFTGADLDLGVPPFGEYQFTPDQVVQVINATCNGAPIVEGVDYYIRAGYNTFCHNVFVPLRTFAPEDIITVSYYRPVPDGADGTYLGGNLGYSWEDTMFAYGTHYPVSISSTSTALKKNPYFFMETPLLGEVDWRWYWTGTTKPRSGYFKVDILDVVKVTGAYSSRGDGAYDPAYMPGADIDGSDLCHVGILDLVSVTGKYAKTFGTPPTTFACASNVGVSTTYGPRRDLDIFWYVDSDFAFAALLVGEVDIVQCALTNSQIEAVMDNPNLQLAACWGFGTFELGVTNDYATATERSGTIGEVFVPVDNHLLAPYAGLTSTILITTASVIYLKRVKRRKEKQ